MNSYLVQNGQLFFAPFQVVLPDKYSVDPILCLAMWWYCPVLFQFLFVYPCSLQLMLQKLKEDRAISSHSQKWCVIYSFAYLRWRCRDVCNFHMIYIDDIIPNCVCVIFWTWKWYIESRTYIRPWLNHVELNKIKIDENN